MSGYFTAVRNQINSHPITHEIEVQASQASLTRLRDQIRDLLAGPPAFSISPELDSTRLDQQWRDWMNRHRNESFDVQARVQVDNRALAALKKTLGGLGSAIGTVGKAGGLLGAAGLAVGAIGPAALAAGPALLGMAAAMAVVKLGADGIKEAFSAITPQVDALKAQVGGVFKTELAPAVSQFGTALTNLTPQFKAVASQMAGSMSQIMNLFSSEGGQEAFTGIFEDIGKAIGNATPGLVAFLETLRDLAASAGLDQLGTAFGSLFQSLADAFAKIDANQIVGIFSQILTAVGPLLGSLIEIFNTLGVTLGPIIAQLLTGLAPVISSLAGPLAVAGKALGEGLLKIFEALAPVIPVVVGALADLFAMLAPIIAQLVSALAPVLAAIAPVLVQIGQVLADAWISAFEQIQPMLPELTTAFVQLVQALIPLLPPILELSTQLLPVLLPLIIKLITMFTDLVNILVPILVPILEKMADVAGVLAGVLSGVLSGALDIVHGAITKVGEVVKAAPGWFSDAKESVSQFASSAVEWIGNFINTIQEIPGKVQAAFNGAKSWLKNAGREIIEGLKSGLSDAWSSLTSWFKDKLNSLVPGGGIVARILPGLANGGPVPARADGGGLVWGGRAAGTLSAPGGPRADRGLFLGSDDEFVVNARAMRGPWGGVVQAINSNSLPRFADGGSIGGKDSKKADWLKFLESIGYKPLFDDATGAKIGEQVTAGITSYKDAVSNVKGWADAIINGGEIPGMEDAVRPVLGLGNPDSGASTPPNYEGGSGANSGLTGGLSDLTGPGQVGSSIGSAVQQALSFAQSQSGKPYQYGGVGSPSWDCSGFMSGIYATIRGLDAYTRWFTTEADFTGSALGFVRGLGGSDGFSIGVHNGGGGQYSHMAGTLAGHSVESGANGVLVDGAALNASSDQFENRYYLPILKEALAGDVSAAKELANIEGAGAARWRDMAIAAMKRQGFDANDARQVDAMVSQIQSESGGDPLIVQQVQDVNSGGNEAGGLLQVIPKTYAAYRDPELVDDRFNGWSNMNAALRYYKERYGLDLTQYWGKGTGYDNGGTISGIGMFGKWTTKPEEVLSPSMTQDFHDMLPFMSTVADNLRGRAPVAGYDDGATAAGATVNMNFGDVRTNSWEDAQTSINRDARRGMRSVLGGTRGGR
ncbi:tape measure protein [Nocardia phage KYD2]|nr:tape measure protein [Nocardia phage KYD2]